MSWALDTVSLAFSAVSASRLEQSNSKHVASVRAYTESAPCVFTTLRSSEHMYVHPIPVTTFSARWCRPAGAPMVMRMHALVNMYMACTTRLGVSQHPAITYACHEKEARLQVEFIFRRCFQVSARVTESAEHVYALNMQSILVIQYLSLGLIILVWYIQPARPTACDDTVWQHFLFTNSIVHMCRTTSS